MYVIKCNLLLNVCLHSLVSLQFLVHHTCLVFAKLTLNTATQPEHSKVRNGVSSLGYEERRRFKMHFNIVTL